MLKKLGIVELYKLFKQIKKRKLPYFTGLFGFSIVEASIVVLIPIIIKMMIDAVLKNDMEILRQGITLAIFEAVLASSLFIWLIYLFYGGVHRIVTDIKIRIMEHVLNLPVAYFEKNHSGDIISRVSNDINVLYGAYGWIIRDILFVSFSGIGSAIVMIILDWRFSIMLLLIGILSAILNAKFTMKIKGISDKLQKDMGKTTEKVSDLLSGFIIVKMFHIEDRLNSKFNSDNECIKQLSIKRTKESNILDTSNLIISWVNFGGIIAIGAIMSINGSVELGTIIGEINLLGNVNFMIRRLGGLFANLQGSLAGAGRVFELLEVETEPESYKKNTEIINDSSYMIEMRNVTFSYEKAQVLKGVDIALEESKIAALVGTSGGGKSTIVKLIMGYYPTDEGGIFINRKPIWDYKLEEIRDLIAYVPQDAFIFDGTIEENIKLGRGNATNDEVVSASKAANAYEFIEEMPDKFSTRVGERGVRLSGGQRQRIAIARAILKNAPILILDEATSSLDSQSEQLVQNALNLLMDGKTVIIIAHRLSTIEHADVIYVVDDGKVTEQGRREELLELGQVYKRLYDCQFSC
jgi:ATP-binding cassette, subfamily B, bacterial